MRAQLTDAVDRILAGSLVAAAVGRDVPGALAVVLVSLFLGLYLFRISYACMVVAITVIVSQLYEQLHELTTSLLVLRLGETAIGASLAAATALVILPLRTTKVVQVATVELLVAVRELVVDAAERLQGLARPGPLADRVRAVDAAFQSLSTTVGPLRHLGGPGQRAQRLMVSAGALRHYGRNLADDVPRAGGACGLAGEAGRAAGALVASLDALIVSGADDRPVYVRSASEWSAVEQCALDALRRNVASGGSLGSDVVGVMLAARDFQLLDGALAELAVLRGAVVEAVDAPARAGVLR